MNKLIDDNRAFLWLSDGINCVEIMGSVVGGGGGGGGGVVVNDDELIAAVID